MTVSIEASAPPAGVSPVQFGAVRDIPLNKLNASPRNARRVGHSTQDIEARAASIRAKGLLQPLVVEPEVREGGEASGYFLVTIGEGRRQALKLLAKRKLLTKVEPIRRHPGRGRVGDGNERRLVSGSARRAGFRCVTRLPKGDGGRAGLVGRANDADGGLVALSGIVIGRADLRPLLA